MAWWPTLEATQDVILENKGDIFECLYNYAVIEQVESGHLQANLDGFPTWWYLADWDHRRGDCGNSPTCTPIERPEWALDPLTDLYCINH